MRVRGGDGGRHQGFGVAFSCHFPLPGVPLRDPDAPADLELHLSSAKDIDAAWSGPAPDAHVADLVLDGLPYRAERGAAGDHLFRYGDRALFHLSADGHTLGCAPADLDDPSWRRVLLDSVLATVSLLRGFEALHAAAVGTPEGVVAFMARTAGGKTTLAVELLRRGLPLVCDDVLALSSHDGRVVGHPAPPLINLPAPAEAPSGVALGEIADETWFAVKHVANRPAPVVATFLLDRRPGAAPRAVNAECGVMDLVAHALHSGDAPQRLQARFELLSDLAEQAQAYVLEADKSTSPERLADLAGQACPALACTPAGMSR